MTVTHITHNTDLVDLEILPDVEIERLTTERVRNEDPPWARRHINAWAKVLHHLSLRPTPIAESDLTDTTELRRATCYMVCHYAYLVGEHEDDKRKAKYYYDLSVKELEEVNLNAGDISRGSYSFHRAYRA